MASEDIAFCANIGCADIKCERNPKNILQPIPHSFALFTDCPKWINGNARWLTEQIEEDVIPNGE